MKTSFRRAKCPRCGSTQNQVWFEKAGRLWAYFIVECRGKNGQLSNKPYQGYHIFRLRIRLAEEVHSD